MVEELYEKYQEELLRWCTRMTGERSQAEDLVHEAYMRAMLHEELLESLSGQQRRAWLYRSVKNLYVDRLRQSRREILSEDSLETGAEDAGMVTLEWQQLLENLPDIEGVLFAMRYLQGYNSTQLGQQFGLPPGTVRAKLSSARQHLKEALAQDAGRRRKHV